MRRAFTMLELLAVVAVIALMLAIGVTNIAGGKGAARVKGATRDIFGAIRHARTIALVTEQPAIVTYSTQTKDGETMAKVEIVSAKLFDSRTSRPTPETLSGAPLRGSSAANDVAEGEDEGGETVEEILFSPMSEDVVKGMRIKVVKGEEMESVETGRKPKISVFSNVDYLIGRYKDAQAEAAAKSGSEGEGEDEGEDEGVGGGSENQPPVSVVWETNGRVEPHRVWVYADGMKPEDGLMISIDRFGAAKVLSGDGKDEDE